MIRTLAFACAVAASIAFTQSAHAQLAEPTETTAVMGHWHLRSADIEANKKLFVAMGGKAVMRGGLQTVEFPGVSVGLSTRDGAPPTGGSVGSTVEHVGFIVKDMAGDVAKWKAAGIDVGPGRNGRLDQAFVHTPDGLRIEILEDKNQAEAIKCEHVHFFVVEAERAKMQEWYAKTLGGTPTQREHSRYVDLPGVQLRFSASDTPQAPTKGRVLDHIGFEVKNLEAFTKRLEESGVKLDRPYTKNPDTGMALAFLTDPWGTQIELNERPAAAHAH
jgi:catechol 2,3-dioxygenase-like lactoylglutathione lyase family enzyme